MECSTSFFDCVCNYLCDQKFQIGMVAALAIMIIAYAIVVIVVACRRKCPAIIIKDDGGNFSIHCKAFQNFLRGVIGERKDLELLGVDLRKRGAKVRITLKLAAKSGADMIEIHRSLRENILKDATEKLGIDDQIESLNLSFVSLPESKELKSHPEAPR